jgi:hypothetical protein
MVTAERASSNRVAANLVTGAVRVYRSLDFLPTKGGETVRRNTRAEGAGERHGCA